MNYKTLPTRPDGGIDWSLIENTAGVVLVGGRLFWHNEIQRACSAHTRERCARLVREMRNDDLCAAEIMKMID